jgi:hypothetical protein
MAVRTTADWTEPRRLQRKGMGEGMSGAAAGEARSRAAGRRTGRMVSLRTVLASVTRASYNLHMRYTALAIANATALLLGCGDSGHGPSQSPAGRELAARFERLADSVDAGGYSPAGEALRHAAEIVRLTGHATPVTVTIDGSARSFLAVAEQLDYPDLHCSYPSDSGWVDPPIDTIVTPPPDSTGVAPPGGGGGGMPPDSVVVPPGPPEPPPLPECTVMGTYSMRTLIAWEPEHMEEVVRIVAHIGSNAVKGDVPDVMTGLPTNPMPGEPPPPATPPDSGSGSGGEPGGFPGFMGEYLVRDVGSWWAVEGNQSNALEDSGGACTDEKATFDWAEFECESARLRFEFQMSVEPVPWEPLTGVADPTGGPEGTRALSMSSSAVDGVRLAWVAWTSPPLPTEPDSVMIGGKT